MCVQRISSLKSSTTEKEEKKIFFFCFFYLRFCIDHFSCVHCKSFAQFLSKRRLNFSPDEVSFHFCIFLCLIFLLFTPSTEWFNAKIVLLRVRVYVQIKRKSEMRKRWIQFAHKFAFDFFLSLAHFDLMMLQTNHFNVEHESSTKRPNDKNDRDNFFFRFFCVFALPQISCETFVLCLSNCDTIQLF